MSSLGVNRRGWIARSGVPAAVAAATVVVLVPVALTSLRMTAVFMGLLVVALMTLTMGAVRAGSAFLVLGFGLVIFDSVHLSGSVKLADPFFVAGFFLLLPRLATSSVRPPTAFAVGAIGFLVVGGLSTLIVANPGLNIGYFQNVARGVVLFPLLLSRWEPRLRVVAAAAFAFMVGNAVNVFASLANGPNFGSRYSGWSTHPNVMAYGQTLSIALVPFVVSVVPRRFRWVVLTLAGLSAYGIWIAGSRGALLCAVALALLYPLLTRSVPAALGLAALVTPAIVIVSNAANDHSSSSALTRLLGASSGVASDQARTNGAKFGIDQFLAHPLLGNGWLNIWGVHVAYIQVAAAVGVLGLAFYLLLLWSLLRPLIAVPAPYGLLALPALAAVMLDVVLPVIGALFEWSVVGLALCAAPLAARRGAPSELAPSSGDQEI